MPPADERQFAQSAAAAVVARYMQSLLNSGQELPEDAAYDEYLVNAVLAAMYGAGELQGYLDDPAVENININGCDEVWVTYADGRKQRKDPVAATDEDLVDIVQALGAYASHNAQAVHAGQPDAGCAAARRVAAGRDHAGQRTAGGVDPPQPLPADDPRAAGPAGEPR